MRIVHLNKFDISGGAARAAYRLHLGLKRIGQNSSMLVADKQSKDSSVFVIKENPDYDLRADLIQNYYIDNNRSPLTNTFYSFDYNSYPVSANPILKQADIINLHWVTAFISPSELRNILKLGKPVVWTLHDQRPFTGGCHYAAGCLKYTKGECKGCPQLAQDPFNIANMNLEDKKKLFESGEITIVTPSRWLADCAKKSILMRNCDIRTIPYSLDTKIFYPENKRQAKIKLGFRPDSFIILLGSYWNEEKRKGFQKLMESLKILMKDKKIQSMVEKKKLEFAFFGAGNIETDLGIKFHQLGYINNDRKLRLTYSAANTYVLPTLEDNLPNTMLESMACGTPVVAFDTGGVPDVIEHQVNGLLVKHGNVNDLALNLNQIIFDKKLRTLMEKEASQVMKRNFSLTVQAKRYLELYHEILRNHLSYDPEKLVSNMSITQKNLKSLSTFADLIKTRLEKSTISGELEQIKKEKTRVETEKFEVFGELKKGKTELSQEKRQVDIERKKKESLIAQNKKLKVLVSEKHKADLELHTFRQSKYYRLRVFIYLLTSAFPKSFINIVRKFFDSFKQETEKFKLVFVKSKKYKKHIRVLYDFQTFAAQKYGGISRLFCELMNIYSRQRNIDFSLGLRYSENGYLKSANFIENNEALLDYPKRGKEFIDFLPGIKFRGKYHLYSLLNFLGFYKYKSKYKVNHYSLFNPIKPYHYYNQYFPNVEWSLDLIRGRRFNVFHPTYFDTYFLKYLRAKPFVLTIYDMIHEKFPFYHDPKDIIAKNKKALVKKAAKIIAISENTKKDIVVIYHIDPNKIKVIPLASSLSLADYKYKKIDNLPKKYLLFVGTRTVYKNFSLFIRAAVPLLRKDKKLFIVATGNIVGAGEFTKKEIGLFKKLKISKRVIFIHAEKDRNLITLYKKAFAFIFPSLYEGFGLPILEAFSCGCPVACSNTSSLPEVAGDGVLYFNPRSKKSIYTAIKKILTDTKLRKELIKKGFERNKLFTWKKTADKTKKIYNEVIRQHEK